MKGIISVTCGLLTRYGASRYLGMSITGFDRYVRPHIPNHGKPGAPRFKASDIDAWKKKVGRP